MIRLLCFGLLLATGIGAADAQGVQSGVRLSPSTPTAAGINDLRRESLARLGRIQKELEGLADHPWAGHYRTPGRFAGQLSLAPQAGFTLYQGSRAGKCSGWRAAGRVTEAGPMQVRLDVEVVCEGAATAQNYWWAEDRLHLVPWGELTFAVPTSCLKRFYLLANDGHSYPDYLFARARRGDPEFDLVRPAGLPAVLPGFEHLVLREPVRASLGVLVRWSPSSQVHPGGPLLHDAVYALDIGAREGLIVGMHLFLEGNHFWAGMRGIVESVEDDTARLEFTGLRESTRSLAERALGSPVSTLHPKAREPQR